MKNIIEQIIEVDSSAFENKTKNERLLYDKKQEYEKVIASYKSEKLDAAKSYSQNVTEEAEAFISENEKSYSNEIKSISTSIEKNYKKVEKELIQKIFNKLFVLEG